MEILLLQDVPNVGKKNDLLLVGDGYALNFLLPQLKAIVATPTVRKRYAEAIKRRAEEKMLEMQTLSSAASKVAGKELVLERKATKTGKLYAAITAKHIAEELLAQHKAEVAVTEIEVPEQIKALGTFGVKVGGNSVSVTVKEAK